MPEPTVYPDVLGSISGGVRVDYGVLQAAAAVQPSRAKSGRPVEATILLQNMTDAPLEVLAVLTVPPRDLLGKVGAFVAKVQRLAIGMQPCEVGVLTLPVLSQPGTEPGIYRLALQITAKATGKGSRIRAPEGGGEFYEAGLPRPKLQLIETLRGLKYTPPPPPKRAGLFGGTPVPVLEAAFTLEAGTLGGVIDRAADYVPLWTRDDFRQDPLVLLERHSEALINYVLPALDRVRLLEPLTLATIARFKDAGFDVKQVEASLIARLMTHIAEYACTGRLSYGRTYALRPEYEVLPLLQMPARERPPLRLHWLTEMLALIDADPRTARFASKFLVENCYDALLHDALSYALGEFEAVTGTNVGTPEELEQFANQWMERLDSGTLTFEDTYLPLVIVGVARHADIIEPEENVKTLHAGMQRMLSNRKDLRNEANQAVFDLTRDVLEKTLHEYGVGLL